MIPAVAAAGGLVGFGGWWLLWQLLPATPALRPAIARLHPAGVAPGVPAAPAWWLRHLRKAWRPPTRELTLLGTGPRQYAISLSASAAVGVAAPTAAAAIIAAAGIGVPPLLPAGVAILLGLLAAVAAHHHTLSRAHRARHEFRRAVCTYLDLVALELAAGWGPVAGLERACAGIDGWVFERLRHTLLQAQLQLHQPWDELRQLARRIDVPELGDVGDIVQAAGADGAVVQETLLSRADSLRDQIRTQALARAKATTTKLDIPGAALLIVLAVFVMYPLLTRAQF